MTVSRSVAILAGSLRLDDRHIVSRSVAILVGSFTLELGT